MPLNGMEGIGGHGFVSEDDSVDGNPDGRRGGADGGAKVPLEANEDVGAFAVGPDSLLRDPWGEGGQVQGAAVMLRNRVRGLDLRVAGSKAVPEDAADSSVCRAVREAANSLAGLIIP